MKKITLILFICLLCLPLWAAHQPEFSTAGFFRLENTGRDVYSMNPAWRFYKGAAQGADAKEFNDKVPNEILSLFSNEEKHKTIVEKEEIKNTIIEWIKK